MDRASLRGQRSRRIPRHAPRLGVDQLAAVPKRTVVHQYPGPGRPEISRSVVDLGLALTSMLFNYVLGEEFLFRGVFAATYVRSIWPLGLGREHGAIRPLPRTQDLGLAQHDRQLVWHRVGNQALPQLLDGRDRARTRGLLHRADRGG